MKAENVAFSARKCRFISKSLTYNTLVNISSVAEMFMKTSVIIVFINYSIRFLLSYLKTHRHFIGFNLWATQIKSTKHISGDFDYLSYGGLVGNQNQI